MISDSLLSASWDNIRVTASGHCRRMVFWTGILGTGLAIRLIAIDGRGLWMDEAWRVWAARLPGAGDVLRVAWAQPPSAPLYWLGLHTWIRLFGHGDVAVRLFSVIPSVACIAAAYWLGGLFGGPAAGRFAAILTVFAPVAVEVGQEATMYAWTMLAASLTIACGIRWLETGKGAAAYVACCSFFVYLHYLAVLVLAWFFLAGLIELRTSVRREAAGRPRPASWFAGHCLVLVLWLPWAFAMAWRIHQRWPELSRLRHPTGWLDLYRVGANLVFSASPLAYWNRTMAVGATAAGCLCLVWALWQARHRYRAWSGVIIIAGTLASLLGTAALTGAWMFQPRFLSIVLPVMIALLALGFTIFGLGSAQIFVRRGVIAGWFALQCAGLLTFYLHPVHGRDGLREIGAWLSASVERGDVVVCNHPLLLWSVAQYYGGPLRGLPTEWDVRFGYPLLPPAQPDWVQAQKSAFPGLSGQAQRIWLLYLPVVDPDGDLLNYVGKRYRLAERRNYPLLSVCLFVKGNK